MRVGEFFYLSRFALRPTRLRELSLSSDGMGDNVLYYFETPGRENLDYFVKLKRDLPSEMSHKLGVMARKFCADDKEDMDYREIPKLQAGTADDRRVRCCSCPALPDGGRRRLLTWWQHTADTASSR